VAEVFAALVLGKAFTPACVQEYKDLGGPVLP